MKPITTKIIILLLSIFIPFIIMLVALAGLGIAPFGDHTLLISDANGYYINTLSYAARMFQGKENVLYSFEKGLGGNMAGHLNGILLTPFAFLLSLADITQYPSVYSFISVLNLSLGGLTMYLFLEYRYGHKRSHLIFSTIYALMGFNVANVFQAVFFCAAPVLPIMAIGLDMLMRGKNPLLYILSIAWGLIGNAYFGFVLCAASVLIFGTEYLLHWAENEGRRLRLFLSYALSSLFGGLLATVLWLPGFLSLKGGRLDQTIITDFTFAERQPLLEIGSKFFIGANSTDELVYGHPNIYVTLLPVLLTMLFFINRNISRQKKMAAGILLELYLLSFYIIAFDMVMHAGTNPNWFNFRYSYVFSFFMLAISAEQWKYMDNTPSSDIRRVFTIMGLVSILIFFKQYDYVKAGAVLLDFGLLSLILLAFWMYRRRPEVNPKSTFELITLILVSIGLFMNYRVCTKNIREWEVNVTEYTDAVMAVDPMVEAVKAADDSFFRMEVIEQRSRTGNDPIFYGYNGVGYAGSNERDFVRTEGHKLGIPWFSNRAYYSDGVPAATDTLLGLKYIIAKKDLSKEKGYEERITLGERNLYENHDALSPVILSTEEALEINTDLTSIFQNLNRVWSAVSGEDTPIFIEEDVISFRSHNQTDPLEQEAAKARKTMKKLDLAASVSSSNDTSADNNENKSGSFDRTKIPEDTAYIEYSFIAKHDGAIYVYERNGITDTGQSPIHDIAWLGNYHRGDTVTGYLRSNVSPITKPVMEELCGRFRVAYADNNVLHAMSETVRSRPLTVEKVKDSFLRGSFTAGDRELLMFTVPYDKGWTLTVDGQKTELKQVFGVFMAAQVPVGSHTYEMHYMPAGLRIGAIISVGTALMLIFYFLYGRKHIWLVDSCAPKKKELNIDTDASVIKCKSPESETIICHTPDAVCSTATISNEIQNETPKSLPTRKRQHGLDFVKAVATLMIVLHHYQQVHNVFFEHGINFYYGRFYFGWLVELFFVISGFLMYNHMKRIRGEISFREFMLSRYFRFQPLMAISVITSLVLTLLFKALYGMPWGNMDVGFLDVVLSAIGLHAMRNTVLVNNPLWYIGVLFVCFALMFGAVWISEQLSAPEWPFFTGILLSGIFLFNSGWNTLLLNVRTARGLYAFFWGLLLAEILHRWKPYKVVFIASAGWLILFPLLIVLGNDGMSTFINYILTFTYYPSLVLVFTSDEVNRVFKDDIWEKLAQVSYNAYVWHSAVFILAAIVFYLTRIVPDFTNITTLIGMVIGVYAIGTLSYHFIDKPCRRWTRSLLEQSEKN